MDYKYIEQLLERYWECQTTLQEENILRAFFSQKDVPASLLKYRELFAYEQSEPSEDTLGEDFDRRMTALIDEPQPVRARTISMAERFKPLFKAAAVVAIVLTLGNAAQITFKSDARHPDVAAVQKPHKGASVAMGDSVKTDTLKKVPAAPAILK